MHKKTGNRDKQRPWQWTCLGQAAVVCNNSLRRKFKNTSLIKVSDTMTDVEWWELSEIYTDDQSGVGFSLSTLDRNTMNGAGYNNKIYSEYTPDFLLFNSQLFGDVESSSASAYKAELRNSFLAILIIDLESGILAANAHRNKSTEYKKII